MLRPTTITTPGAPAPGVSYHVQKGQLVALRADGTLANPIPQTTAKVQKFTAFDAYDVFIDAGNAASDLLGRPALSGPEFRFDAWRWYPWAQTAVHPDFGRVEITSARLVQALQSLERLSSTFTRSEATLAASYLDAAGSDPSSLDAATMALISDLTTWLGGMLESNGKISKEEAAKQSGTNPDNWKDPSQLGDNKGFLDTLYEQAQDTVKPLATALGITTTVALVGIGVLAYLMLRK